MPEEPETEPEIPPWAARNLRGVRLIAHLTWLGGLGAIYATGGLVWITLQSAGVSMVSWSRGVSLFIPVALFHAVPLILLALVEISACKAAIRGRKSKWREYVLAVLVPAVSVAEPKDAGRLWAALSGAGLLSVVWVCYSLFTLASYQGPGGFAEAVIMTLALFPLTLGALMLHVALAAAIGGALGSGIYVLVRRRGRKQDKGE